MSITQELEYWKAGLLFVGAVLGTIITGLSGYIIAKKRGFTDTQLADMAERAKFRGDLQSELHEAWKRIDALQARQERLEERISQLQIREANLVEVNTQLTIERNVLLLRVDNLETQILALDLKVDSHLAICPPKVIQEKEDE